MIISSFHLHDYKSYSESTDILLKPGINIIFGQNDAGKSALLEGLGLNFKNNPHRNSNRRITANTQSEQESAATVSFTINNDELLDILRNFQGQFFVPLPEVWTLIRRYQAERPDGISEADAAKLYVGDLLKNAQFTFKVYYRSREQARGPLSHIPQLFHGMRRSIFPALEGYDAAGSIDKHIYAPCHLSDDGELIIDREDQFLDAVHDPDREPFDIVRKPQLYTDREDDLDFGLHIARILRQRVYLFSALRAISGRSEQDGENQLRSDASNLASVLANLDKTPKLRRDINERLRAILPQVYEVTTRRLPLDSSPQTPTVRWLNEIIVYYQDGGDLSDAVPLADCGTGVGQILAILSIIISAKHPQTIIIDEPQSFLHPGAVRKLIDLFKQYSQHQYIIATHSPALIAAAEPTAITLVTKEKVGSSKLTSIDREDLAQINLCMAEVGASFSDAFGYDRVLWVEGDTEKECFPLILGTRLLIGTAVVAVHNTGDLSSRRVEPERIIGIYKRLCEGKGLLPPTLSFVFDPEGRTGNELQQMKDAFIAAGIEERLIQFLPRRMYENYLLDPRAIVKVLEHFGKQVDEAEISVKLTAALANTKYNSWVSSQPTDPSARPQWKATKPKDYYHDLSTGTPEDSSTIHAANVLIDLFAEYGCAYRKVETGRMLTEWLLENDPVALSDIKTLLEELFS